MKLYIFILVTVHVVLGTANGDELIHRTKRQGVSIGFGLPNFQAGHGGQGGQGGQPFGGFGIPNIPGGQAIGGIFNSFLSGLQGPQGQRPGQQAVNCNTNNGGCQHICRFLRNRVECACNPGYFLHQDRKTCNDIDECRQQPRPCQELCTNSVGSFTCGCTPGRTLLPDNSCVAASTGTSCAQNNGGCQQRCEHARRGGVRCSCNIGYDLALNRRSCVDIDECASGLHDCGADQRCVNIDGDYDCIARLSPVVVDPCQVNNGGCQHICTNLQGVAQCQCNQGFNLVGGTQCQPPPPPTAAPTAAPPPPPPTTTTTTPAPPPPPPTTTTTTPAPPPPPSTTAATAPPPPPSTTAATAPPPPPTPVTESPARTNECGVNNKKSLFVRIVGGKPADPKDWPWMAALLRDTEGTQFCGGTLITDRHVLTAAHCVQSFTSKDLRIRLGEYSFDTPDENSPTDFKVDEIRKHERYSTETQENDIALLKLDRATTFSEFIWPACLPPPDNKFEDQLGYVTGWGTIFFGGPVSKVLQEVVVPVWKQDDCVAAYPDNKVADSMMCCGRKVGGVDSCQGDSGGPFLIQIFPGKRWYVAGVVSWGIECASPNRPGVYTRVNHYLDWIKDNAV